MSWNPNDNDPWGRKNNNNPPDLEEAIKKLRDMFFSGGVLVGALVVDRN